MAKCIQCGRQLPAFSFKKICQWCQLHEAEQRGEVTDEVRQRVMPTPWVRGESSITLTQVIFGANIVVFLAMIAATIVATGSPSLEFPISIERHFGGNYGLYTLTGEWWRLFIYMFLHSGAMHIFFNMWCLWDLGRLCESLYGRWTFAAIYVSTGLAGGLASAAWNPGATSVGASGAIFGLAGALIASFYLGEFSLPRVAISGTLRSLLIFAVFNLVIGQVIGGIDNACHVGGLVSGLGLGAVTAKIAPHEEHNSRRVLFFIVTAILLAACAVAVARYYGAPLRLGRSPFRQ